MSSDEIARVIETGNAISDAKLFIDDTRGQNMLRIAANARRLNRKHGLRMLVIDYVQLIMSDDRRRPEYEQITDISRRLTHLAGELKIPVLALCQLNRESEQGSGREPRMSDLRGSGSLEQDADCVLLMHRPSSTDRSRIVLDVAKNRSGPVGRTELFFDDKYMRFENASVDSYSEKGRDWR